MVSLKMEVLLLLGLCRLSKEITMEHLRQKNYLLPVFFQKCPSCNSQQCYCKSPE